MLSIGLICSLVNSNGDSRRIAENIAQAVVNPQTINMLLKKKE
jgi:hypothetical protein